MEGAKVWVQGDKCDVLSDSELIKSLRSKIVVQGIEYAIKATTQGSRDSIVTVKRAIYPGGQIGMVSSFKLDIGRAFCLATSVMVKLQTDGAAVTKDKFFETRESLLA